MKIFALFLKTLIEEGSVITSPIMLGKAVSYKQTEENVVSHVDHHKLESLSAVCSQHHNKGKTTIHTMQQGFYKTDSDRETKDNEFIFFGILRL